MTRAMPMPIPGARGARIQKKEIKIESTKIIKPQLFNKDLNTIQIIPEGGGVFFMDVPLCGLSEEEKAAHLPPPPPTTPNNSGKCLFPSATKTGLFR